MSQEKVGDRIRERLLAQGYKRDDGEPNVQEFCWTFRFNPNHLYAWMRGDMLPSSKHLPHLCDGLGCSEVWLLTGKERDPKALPGKARQQHGRIRSLWLALPLAAASVMWPTGSVPAQGHADESPRSATLPIPSYRKRQVAYA